jgi:hypothetical protein
MGRCVKGSKPLDRPSTAQAELAWLGNKKPLEDLSPRVVKKCIRVIISLLLILSANKKL